MEKQCEKQTTRMATTVWVQIDTIKDVPRMKKNSKSQLLDFVLIYDLEITQQTA